MNGRGALTDASSTVSENLPSLMIPLLNALESSSRLIIPALLVSSTLNIASCKGEATGAGDGGVWLSPCKLVLPECRLHGGVCTRALAFWDSGGAELARVSNGPLSEKVG
jgi:hypothetical protein